MVEVDIPAEFTDYIRRRLTDYTLEPFPNAYVPVSGAPLAGLSDEDLLDAPAAMLSHIIRTAGNGGIQVMGPSAIPCTQLIRRVLPTERQSDLIVCGSVASKDMSWPTYDGRALSAMDAYEPYKSTTDEPSLRGVLKTVSVSTGMERPENPVEAAIVTAVGLVALQREVGGDSRRLAELYDKVWGLEEGTMEDFERYTLGPQGDLLRYVLGQEKAQPRANMPLQASKAISVSMGPQVRSDYGPHRSMDWARIRVVAEARYYMSTRVEGIPLEALSSGPPPGNLTAALSRPGILIFQPYPMSGFSYADSTLSLTIPVVEVPEGFKMPLVMEEKVRSLFDADNPNRKYLVNSRAPKYTISRTAAISTLGGSSIVSANTNVLEGFLTAAVRGKSVARILRSQVYSSINATLEAGGEGIEIVAEMLRVAEEIGKVTRVNCVKLIPEMTKVCGVIGLRLRDNLSAELGRHKSNLEEVWISHREILPLEIRPIKEGTIGWLNLIFYELLTSNDVKWAATVRAVNADRISVLATSSYDALLPPGDREEVSYLVALMNNLVEYSKRLWAKYYDSTARVAYVLGKTVDPGGSTAQINRGLRLGGIFWEFRARVVSTAKMRRIDPAKWETNPDAVYSRVTHEGVEHLFEFSYNFDRQWAAMLGSMRKSGFSSLCEALQDTVTPVGWASGIKPPFGKKALLPGVRKTRVTRYVVSPNVLWSELAKTLLEIQVDAVGKAAAQFRYVSPVLPNKAVGEGITIQPLVAPPEQVVPNAYTLLTEHGGEPSSMLDYFEDVLGEEVVESIMRGHYADYDELMKTVGDMIGSAEAEESAKAESKSNSVW